MSYWKGKLTDHFDKILLAVLFIFTVALTVHLMHKSDAGGEDTAFIVWAETQAAMILGRLVGMIQSTPNGDSNIASESTQMKDKP